MALERPAAMTVDVRTDAWRRSRLERGQLRLLALLALLTVGAWGFSIHQARTMDMPMGGVGRSGADADPRNWPPLPEAWLVWTASPGP